MRFLPSASIVFSLFGAAALATPPASIRPLDEAQRPLNLGFEDGTLSDWIAVGEAFQGQPIKGPIDPKRPNGAGKFANHRGDFWIGGYEKLRDQPKGTLTSVPFKATQPWASFLIGGGSLPGTRVEIVTKDDGKVIHTARGVNQETMERSLVDLRKFAGREIFIRIVDDETPGWGHVNFDDFVFHAEEPKFDKTAPVASAPPGPVDEIKFAGLPPEQAAKEATLPAGFAMKLFAGEPDIVQPIAFCLDDRARLWVVQGMTYPKRAAEGEGKDSILVFEDTDGDGRFDKRTVFTEGLNLVSGIEVGYGGVFVGAAPNLMFIPMLDGDAPKPAGPPQILLDGWGFQDTHETLNTFTWGPDGWLYGCHGVFTKSNVGAPGTPDAKRVPLNAGVWRFHPLRHEFELFAEGTSNPWGLDFDARGQAIIEACVIPHLFHMIQGGRYQRQAGAHFNSFTYDDIKTIADHRHFVGATPHGGNGRSDAAGGGHAHAGLLIYQGESWPEKYRGQLFMNNIHGARINMDIPERAGSGFVAHHGADFINFNDRASQIVNLLEDQNGSVFMIDWYDLNQCHRPQPEAHDRSNGRIFKVVYGGQKTTPVDLGKKSDSELAALVTGTNEWLSRHARRLLAEHAAHGKIALPDLEKSARESEPHAALRALWALHATGNLSESLTLGLLNEKAGHEDLAAWTVQLACERPPSDAIRTRLAQLAKETKSPVTRLYLASAAGRLPIEQRLAILEPLLQRAEDASDVNLPLLEWYALEPVIGKDPAAAALLLEKVAFPQVRECIARRLAAVAQARN
ncbi:MAG: PVC-type heme-binding CxxCH protein [Chthoniobacteraceae bacterium]